MQTHRLVCHPDTPAIGHFDVTVEVTQESWLLLLKYRIAGETSRLVLPEPVSYRPERGDRLWEHTCFEAFWKSAESGAYHEINVAPSREYAIYRFDSYRAGMCAVDPFMPRIFYHSPRNGTALDVRLAQPFEGASYLGLSAVIEETDGTKSYWALRHPPGKPDFHHPDCFALTLPAPDAL